MPEVYAYKQVDSLGQPVDWQVFFHTCASEGFVESYCGIDRRWSICFSMAEKKDGMSIRVLRIFEFKDLDGL